MRLYFDERGDYAFPSDRFDCYVQAAVICPDSFCTQAETFVDSRCESWGMPELHAARMSAERLRDIAEFIADSPIELGVQLTDTVHTTKAVIGEFRLSQAHAYAQSLKRYRKGGGTDSSYITDTRTRIKQAGLSSQISDGEFVQSTLLVDGVLQAVQRCLYAYPQDRWRDDFEQFRVIVDGKLSGKRSAAEKYLAEMIILILGGSDRYTLNWNPQWHDEPLHPFVRRFVVDGRVELDALSEHGVQFARSEQHAGLQLADLVANVVHRAVIAPSTDVMSVNGTLTRRLADRYGRCVVIARFPGVSGREKLEVYRHVAIADRRDELAGPRW